MKHRQFNSVVKIMKYLLLAFTVVSVSVYAQLQWHELNFQQQKLLLPFESEWNGMDIETRNKLIKNTNKWLAMTPEEKKLSHQKLNKFKQLPIEQQQRIKSRAEQFKNLAPEQKRQLKNAHRKFQQLSPEQKHRIRRKFSQLTPEQQIEEIKKFKRNKRKEEFINRFDIEKRRPIINMFKSLEEKNKIKLRRHLIHLPPKQRHSLTLELLEMNISQRIKFIESI